MLVQLRKHCADVKMGICLNLWSLQSCFDGESFLEEVKGSSHLANSTIIASHVVEGHCHAEFVRIAELL